MCLIIQYIYIYYLYIYQLNEDQTSHIDNHFCFAGKPNAIVKLFVINIETKETIHLEQIEHYFNDYYILQVKWFCDNSIGILILNREQTKLHLVRYDLQTKKYTILITDENTQYITTKHNMFESCKLDDDENNTFHIIFSSERNGFNHFYLYQWNGNEAKLINQISYGNGEVIELIHIDSDRELLYNI